MASLEEFVSAVQSSIEALKQAQSSMDTPKQQAEVLSSQFQGLGAESMATGSQGLKEGVEQTQGMVPPIITQLEQLISSAQGMQNGLRAETPEVRPPPTPLDAAPPSLREPVAKIGDPVTVPGGERDKPSLENDGAEDKSRLARFIRNAGDVQDATKNVTETALNLDEFFRAPKPTFVGTQDQGPTIQEAPPTYGKAGVSLAVVMGAITVSRGIQLVFERRRKKADE